LIVLLQSYPGVARDHRMQCSRALLATLRLCGTRFARCPEFTIHGF